MAKEKSLIGIFAYVDELVAAIRDLKKRGVKIHTVYSPVPRHEIREALGLSELSTVRFFTLTGGILGVLTGVGLVIFTSVQWNFVVSGKPIVPLVPAVVVAFEFCILMGILFNLAGMLIKTRMPRLRLPDHYDPRFAEDRFGVLVHCVDHEREEIARILTEAGAEEVHDAN